MEQARTFKDIKESIKGDTALPFKIVTEGDMYITVEDGEGFRAYMQAAEYPSESSGLIFNSVHLPNKRTGTGYRENKIPADSSMPEIIKALKLTLGKSKIRIVMGLEQMDTRKPHKNGKFLMSV